MLPILGLLIERLAAAFSGRPAPLHGGVPGAEQNGQGNNVCIVELEVRQRTDCQRVACSFLSGKKFR
jgi:hypothetical protein